MGINEKLWKDKRVLVTGHTGFKGSWLTLILHKLGAQVYGISLPAIQPRSLYSDAKISELLSEEYIQDIREVEKLAQIIKKIKPDVIALGYDQIAFTDKLQEKIQEFGLNTKVVRLKSYKNGNHKSSKILKRLS